MGTLRERFAEDFVLSSVEGQGQRKPKLRYVYTGPWYFWANTEDSVGRRKAGIAAAGLLSAAFLAISSVQAVPVNTALPVIAPGTLSIIALMYELLGVIQFLLSRRRMMRHTFTGIDRKLKIAPPMHALLMLATVLASAHVMASSQTGFSHTSILVTLGYMASGSLSLLICLIYRGLRFTSEKNAAQTAAAKEAI